MNQPLTKELKIEARIDTGVLATTSMTSGAIAINNVMQAMEVARLMAVSGKAVRKHLREQPGTCLALVIQANEWGMSPFAVASKSYEAGDQLAFESQLIQAVILSRAPIKNGINFSFQGEGQERFCIATAETLAGLRIEVQSPKIRDIRPKNSPLWVSDPDQQLSYYTGRTMCRRYFPNVLLGVYAVDEIEPEERTSGLVERLDAARTARPTEDSNGFRPDSIVHELGGGVAETDVHPKNEAPVTRYFYHPESETLFTTEGTTPISDGHVEELSEDQFREIEAKQKTAVQDPEMVRAGGQAAIDEATRVPPDDLSPADQAAWLHGYDTVLGSK